MRVEAYSHVRHLVSNVTGSLRSDCDAFDVLAATFPGASITGVPKVRCMEIIDALEPVRRGIYTGSAGYIGLDGAMDFNILIRTFLLQDGQASFHVGGGIVADSQPEREYQETLAKGHALREALHTVRPPAAATVAPARRSRKPAGTGRSATAHRRRVRQPAL
jgi:para-aminobenzoate synthetase component 1